MCSNSLTKLLLRLDESIIFIGLSRAILEIELCGGYEALRLSLFAVG